MTTPVENPVEELAHQVEDYTGPSEFVGQTFTPPGEPPVPQRVNRYSTIYRCDTGLPHEVLTGQMNNLLAMLNELGQPVWSSAECEARVSPGRLLCLLHPDHPERAVWDRFGLKTCRKENLRNPMQVDLHMQKKHPNSWQVIKQHRSVLEDQRTKDETRALQERQIAALETQNDILRLLGGTNPGAVAVGTPKTTGDSDGG